MKERKRPGEGRSPKSSGPDSTDLTAPDCPDCTATVGGGRLAHEDSCPIGRGLDEFREADRAWFNLHPFADRRWRPLHWAEVASMRHLAGWPPHGEIVGRVEVIRIGDSVRARRFRDVVWFPGRAA